MDKPDTGYDEDEASLILKRAAELAVQPHAQARTSLGELEEAAAGAGIDKALVRQAAAELATQSPPSPDATALVSVPEPPAPEAGGWLGAPTQLTYEHTVPGRLDDDTRNAVVSALQRYYNGPGTFQSNKRELVWQPRNQRSVTVSLNRRRPGVALRINERNNGLAGGLFGGILGGGAGVGIAWILPVAIAALEAPAAIPVLFVLWMAALWYFTRAIFVTAVRARRRQHAEAIEGLVAVIADGARPRAHGADSNDSNDSYDSAD